MKTYSHRVTSPFPPRHAPIEQFRPSTTGARPLGRPRARVVCQGPDAGFAAVRDAGADGLGLAWRAGPSRSRPGRSSPRSSFGAATSPHAVAAVREVGVSAARRGPQGAALAQGQPQEPRWCREEVGGEALSKRLDADQVQTSSRTGAGRMDAGGDGEGRKVQDVARRWEVEPTALENSLGGSGNSENTVNSN